MQSLHNREESITTAREIAAALKQGQEALSKARQDLLVERSRFRSCGKGLQAQRHTTAEAEVHFMNALREFYHGFNGDLPASLVSAYEKVVEKRDEFGSMEDDYFHAESKLSGVEWTYLDKERVFYQHSLQDILSALDHIPTSEKAQNSASLERTFSSLSSPPLPPPPSPPPLPPLHQSSIVYDAPPPPPHTHQTALQNLAKLKKEFEHLRSEYAHALDPESSTLFLGPLEPFDRYNDLLADMAQYEVTVQRLRQELRHRSQSRVLITYGARSHSRSGTHYKPANLAQITTLFDNSNDEDPQAYRIHNWLLENLRYNVDQRIVYQEFLLRVGISVPDRNSLEEVAGRNWFIDSTKFMDQSDDRAFSAISNEKMTLSKQSQYYSSRQEPG